MRPDPLAWSAGGAHEIANAAAPEHTFDGEESARAVLQGFLAWVASHSLWWTSSPDRS